MYGNYAGVAYVARCTYCARYLKPEELADNHGRTVHVKCKRQVRLQPPPSANKRNRSRVSVKSKVSIESK